SFEISVPAGMPKIAIGSISAARTQPIFAVDPVVARTNHGSATKVIDDPVSETSSAATSPSRERFRSMAKKIIRMYGFVNSVGFRPVPKVSQEHIDARRAQILDGARRAFAQHGYEGATVPRLEAATGLSRGAIFHYYGSKQDLFVALAWDLNTRLGDILLERGLAAAVRALTEESAE